MSPVDPRFCAILDLDDVAGDPEEIAVAAARGGCTLLQVAGTGSLVRRAVETIHRIRARLGEAGIPVIVTGRVDMAIAAGADGVMLEQTDLHPVDARALLGRGKLVGFAVQTPAQADELYRLPVDLCWVSPVFPPDPESAPVDPQGLNGLSRVAFRARLASGGIPVGAAGGIDLAHVGPVIGAAADGVAVRLPALSPDEVLETAGAIRRKVDEALAAKAAQRP